jgi:hypothetical protein
LSVTAFVTAPARTTQLIPALLTGITRAVGEVGTAKSTSRATVKSSRSVGRASILIFLLINAFQLEAELQSASMMQVGLVRQLI